MKYFKLHCALCAAEGKKLWVPEWSQTRTVQRRCMVADCAGSRPACRGAPACTELQTALSSAFLPAGKSAKLRGFSLVQFYIRQIQQVLADVTLCKHKNQNETQKTRKKMFMSTPSKSKHGNLQQLSLWEHCWEHVSEKHDKSFTTY